MREFSISTLLVISAVLLTGCSQSEKDYEAVGAALLKPFKTELQAALRDGIAQGPVEAISVCQVQAVEIAEKYSSQGVRMGRTSHRLRNSANAGPDWVKPILDEYLADVSKRKPQAVMISPQEVGYVEPILVQPVCLMCHGAELDAAVAGRINELYPEDQAVGFQTGDLRGVFWTEFPVSM